MVHWVLHRSCWTAGDYCYLQDLFVAPDVRGGGHGRALIEHVYAQARAVNVARVYWLTHETNHTAMQLYDRIADRPGFIQYRKTLCARATPTARCAAKPAARRGQAERRAGQEGV